MRPADPVGYYNRGISRINVNNNQGGCEDFAKAVELGYGPAKDMQKMYCSN
jgi:hypothetical protein